MSQPNSHMKVSPAGRKLRRHFEGGPALTGYCCSAGVPTFAWGSTSYVDETGTVQPVMEHQTFSIEECERADERDEERHADIIRDLVTVELKQHQFDALVSWAYNFGQPNIEDSATLKALNSGNTERFLRKLMLWIKVNGQPMRGLYRRRCAEALMFMGLPWEEAVSETHPDGRIELDTAFFDVLVPRARNIAERKKMGRQEGGATPEAKKAKSPPPTKPQSPYSRMPEEVSYGVESDGRSKPLSESERANGYADEREGRLWQIWGAIIAAPAVLFDRFFAFLDSHFTLIVGIAGAVGVAGLVRYGIGRWRRKRGEERASELLH